ncbi:MAG: hypothetical protein M3P18_01185 [Actinomycetota bacterium]|nr:hypothetical protein [Actinomycetota bacterium]
MRRFTHERRRLLVATLAAGLLVLGAQSASATNSHPSFKATFSGGIGFNADGTISFVGSGSATRMGHITNHGTIFITGDGSCPGGKTNTNTETLTDNDGNTLTITSHDVGCPIGPGLFHGTGNWTVTSGTGRYAGASGSGTADGYTDFNSGTFTMTLSGTLSIPADG